MDRITIELPVVVDPINQTSPQLDLADWLPRQFPRAIAPSNWPAEPSSLPVIEW